MIFKYFIILCTAASLVVGCRAQQATPDVPFDPYENLTFENVREECDPVESWVVGAMGVPGMVVKFENCYNVKTLLMIITHDSKGNNTLANAVINVFYLSYLDYINESEKWEGKLIKEVEVHDQHEGIKIKSNVAFYRLKSSKEKK